MTEKCVPVCRGMVWIKYWQSNETIDITRSRSAQTAGRSLLHKQKEELNIDEKDQKIIEEEILGKGHAGYAYIYPFNDDIQEAALLTNARIRICAVRLFPCLLPFR